MNDLMNKLANDTDFTVSQIITDVLCPDYDGPEMDDYIVAFNSLPQSVRDQIVETIERNHRGFTEAIVKECIRTIQRKVNRNGSTPGDRRSMKHINDLADKFGITMPI